MLIEKLLLAEVLVQLELFIFEDILQTSILEPLQLQCNILLVFLDPAHQLIKLWL
jgi:hypothetical protein